MPDDLGSDTSSEKPPGTPDTKRPVPPDTIVQHGVPNLALDPNAPAPPTGYELIAEVGRGGMGVVYRARDLTLGRDVAIKILHEQYPADGPDAKQFLEEASITGQLVHPGIPPIHHIGAYSDGRPFLVMKLIKGFTLNVLLGEQTELGRLLAIFEKLCEAVGYAHERGVIHRDLKPSNVMVGAFGEVQVMDWGIAKALANGRREPAGEIAPSGESQVLHQPAYAGRSPDNTLPGSVMGTPGYMSPEQAAGELDRLDRRADVFSLGGVLCAILTGRAPYTGESRTEIQLKAVRAETAEAFAALDACGADPELIAIAKRCLRAYPDDRPRDAGEVAKAVAAFRATTEGRARQAELARVRAETEREVVARVSSSQVTPAAEKSAGPGATRRAMLFGIPAVAIVASVGAYFAFRDRDNPPGSGVNGPPTHPPAPVPPAILVPERKLEGDVSGVAVSDDGRWLAVAFGDWDPPMKVGGVKLFDRSRGAVPEVWWKWRDTACRGVAFSPDGRFLAVAAGNALRVVNLSDEQEVAFADATFEGLAQSVAFSPDGKRLAVAIEQPIAADHTPRPGFARVWDVNTRAKPTNFEQRGSKLPVRCVAFSSDSMVLATGLSTAVGDLGSAVEVWNVTTGAHVAQVDAPLAVSGPYIAFARSAPLCAISSQNEVRIYQLPNPEPFKDSFMTNPAGETTAIALRADGVVVAFAVGGNIYLGEAKNGTVYATLGKHEKGVASLAFTLDGKTLISGGHEGVVREWIIPAPK